MKNMFKLLIDGLRHEDLIFVYNHLKYPGEDPNDFPAD